MEDNWDDFSTSKLQHWMHVLYGHNSIQVMAQEGQEEAQKECALRIGERT